jgi:hypothetical protein
VAVLEHVMLALRKLGPKAGKMWNDKLDPLQSQTLGHGIPTGVKLLNSAEPLKGFLAGVVGVRLLGQLELRYSLWPKLSHQRQHRRRWPWTSLLAQHPRAAQ